MVFGLGSPGTSFPICDFGMAFLGENLPSRVFIKSSLLIIIMVLQGQDAWRKHPLISGLWKKPFPHLGLAAGLFAVYCTAEFMINKAVGPTPSAPKAKYSLKESGLDTMPESRKIGGGHH